MNIEQFELILCDMYTMDAWSPPLLWKWKKEFKEASTKQWAIRELENYIRKRLHHRSDGSVDEFIRFTNEFAMKMARYSNHSGENQEMHEIFQTASSVAADMAERNDSHLLDGGDSVGMTDNQYKGMLLDQLEDWQEILDLAIAAGNTEIQKKAEKQIAKINEKLKF